MDEKRESERVTITEATSEHPVVEQAKNTAEGCGFLALFFLAAILGGGWLHDYISPSAVVPWCGFLGIAFFVGGGFYFVLRDHPRFPAWLRWLVRLAGLMAIIHVVIAPLLGKPGVWQ